MLSGENFKLCILEIIYQIPAHFLLGHPPAPFRASTFNESFYNGATEL